VQGDATVKNSFLSPGCVVEGTVLGSVLSPGVRVARGARVVDSILFHRCTVERDACVQQTIADKGVTVGAGARVGPAPTEGALPPSTPVTLLGKECRVGPGAELEPGCEIHPEAVRG
jgi:glucose-1-phosphate adenylyltransferase